jgi:hypothetical protein
MASPKSPGAASLVLALIACCIEAFFVRMARCGVSAGPDGLIVRQPFSRVDVPWSLVDHVEVDQAGALTISLSSGVSPVYGFGGSVIGMITKGVHARRARDGLLAASQAARGQSGYLPTTSRTALYWKWAVTTALVLEAAALTGLLTQLAGSCRPTDCIYRKPTPLNGRRQALRPTAEGAEFVCRCSVLGWPVRCSAFPGRTGPGESRAGGGGSKLG